MFLKIALSQARHKWGVALLIFLAMTSLVVLYVYSSNTAKFANRSMELAMKNMGHNLLILPAAADSWSVYLGSDDQAPFPDEVARRMSQALSLSSRYYVAVLQSRVQVEDQELLLTGIEPVARKDETREKGNLLLPLGDQEIRLGSEAARKLHKLIAVTGLQEVVDRKQETGIMIAMGVSHAYIVTLYLAKTLVLALLASILGFSLGSLLAVQLSTPFLLVNTEPVAILWRELPATVGWTGAVAMAAEAIPVVRLLSLDPNTILVEQ